VHAVNNPNAAAVAAARKANTYPDVELGLRGGPLVVKNVQPDVACGLSVSALGVEPPPTTATTAPSGMPAVLLAPATAPTGTAKWSWYLETGGGPYAGGTTKIER
jgi:hypothetical protein